MKYIVSFFALFVLCGVSAQAQKIVIGSKVPQIRGDKDVEWLSAAPSKGEFLLLDFFSADNASCVKEFLLLDPIFQMWDDKLEVVIVSGTDNAEFRRLVDVNGGSYSFALDDNGSVFVAYGVRYLPFYMLVNTKGEMVWQGNISTLTTDKLEELLR